MYWLPQPETGCHGVEELAVGLVQHVPHLVVHVEVVLRQTLLHVFGRLKTHQRCHISMGVRRRGNDHVNVAGWF